MAVHLCGGIGSRRQVIHLQTTYRLLCARRATGSLLPSVVAFLELTSAIETAGRAGSETRRTFGFRKAKQTRSR